MGYLTSRIWLKLIDSRAVFIMVLLLSLVTISAAAAEQQQKTAGGITASRFIDNGNGTVTDAKSGYIWLKKADCLGRSSWSDAKSAAESLLSGSCGLSDGSKKGDWRIPTVNEFLTLTDYALVDSAAWLNTAGFKNVSPRGHWTSTTYAVGESSAWVVRMESGSTTYYLKFFSNQVWPIRRASPTSE